MYDWRRMTIEERQRTLEERRQRGYPLHSPPHIETARNYRLISAACYEPKHLLNSAERLLWVEGEVLKAVREVNAPCYAWCVLPNHYHLLLQVRDIKKVTWRLGRMHGRTSRAMNLKDEAVGRQVWYRAPDRIMRSEAHFYTTINYIHHNPVKHGFAAKWQDWPFSSVHWYLENKGREWLLEMWKNYPLLGYGDKWDR